MSFIDDEIARQPAAWRRAADLATAYSHALPAPGERIAVIGCGTSWFMAEAYARLREGAGHGESDFFTASEFEVSRRYDRLVAITRSGTTTEVIDLLRSMPASTNSTVITAVPDSPVAEYAGTVLDLSFADEQSVVQTLFATTALTLLRAQLGHDIEPLATAAQAALALEVDPHWLQSDQITFLGIGWAHGIAREAALKMREAAQVWTEAYPSLEYRHGPISIAQPGRLVWHFGPDAASLADDVAKTGAAFINHPRDPMVDLVMIHRLAAAAATAQGLDPDHPRNLTRSVVLT